MADPNNAVREAETTNSTIDLASSMGWDEHVELPPAEFSSFGGVRRGHVADFQDTPTAPAAQGADAESRNPPRTSNEHLPLLDERNGQNFEESRACWRWSPIQPPVSLGYPSLDFRPTILKPSATFSIALLYTLLAAISALLPMAFGQDAVFTTENPNTYFLTRYLPPILGTLSTVIFTMMVRELRRMLPYVAMADSDGFPSGGKPSDTFAAQYYPVLPPGKINRPILWVSVICSLCASFVVSFKSVLFTVSEKDGEWTVAVHFIPAWVLAGVFTLCAVYTLGITISLWSRSTGLKTGWDPASISDLLALFYHCSRFDQLEEDDLPNIKTLDSQNPRYRLGYWMVQKRRDSEPRIVYGISAIFKDDEAGGKDWDVQNHTRDTQDGEAGLLSQLVHGPHTAYYNQHPPQSTKHPHRRSPFLPPWIIPIWTIILIAALALCTWCLDTQLTQRGFDIKNTWNLIGPSRPSNRTSAAPKQTLPAGESFFSAPFGLDKAHDLFIYAFVFRFIPVYIAGFFTVNWIQSVNIHMSFTQPFANMIASEAPASDTILLDYLSMSPLEVPLTAWTNGHYKVAWFSALNFVSPLFPLAVTGIFGMVNNIDFIHFEISLPPLIVTIVFLIVFILSIPFSWPTAKRRLPRTMRSIMDSVIMCNRSHLRSNPEFGANLPWWSQDDLRAHIQLRREKYLFGVYRGVDGKDHIGFDIAESRGERTGFVTPTVDLRRRRPQSKNETSESTEQDIELYSRNWSSGRIVES